jgi:hypothetical protein
MICSKCNNEVRPDAKFCDNCGAPVLPLPPPAPIELSCLVCGEKIEPGAPFCTKCGMPSVASQTDMTLVLPKKPVPKPEGETDSGAASEFPTLQPSDEVTLGVSEEWQNTLNAGDKRSTEPTPAKLIPLGEVTEAYVPRPVVPMSVNASSEETIMVLDTPPAKPGRSAEASKPEGSRSAKATASKPHKSSRSSAERERQKKHSGKKPVKAGNNTVLIGGIAAVVIVVLAAAVAASWWFKPHRSRKPVEVPAAVSAPAPAPGPVAAVSPPAPVAPPPVAPPPVQAPIVPAETAAASQPAELPTSDLKTASRPALIVAPSVSSGTEASQNADKAAKSEKSETAESAKPVSSAKSSRKQTKAAPKSNQEDNYLRQIHRQLDRQ